MDFGPSYFEHVPMYGVGLGLNPGDAHDAYLEAYPEPIQYFEVTAPSSRARGHGYAEDIWQRRRKPGFHYWRLTDYPPGTKRIIHSTNVNPAYPEPLEDAAYEALAKLVEETKSPWITEDLGIWLMNERHVYPYFMPMNFSRETLVIAINNIRRFHDRVGVPFNAEFPPVQVIFGDMNAFEFFARLCAETGCGMCIDIGHVLSYQLARNASPTADLHLIPWASVTEVHLAGGGIDLEIEGFHYDDAHGDYPIVSACFDILDQVVALAPSLRAITVEVFGARDPVGAIDKCRQIAERDAVRGWLTGKLTPIPEVDLENAANSVRKAAIAMYDLLYSGESISGERLWKAGPELLGSLAQSVQLRLEKERSTRLELGGRDLAGLFPLTARWLMRRDLDDETRFYHRALEALRKLGGDGPGFEARVAQAFGQLVAERAEDSIGQELLCFEVWLNDCVAGRAPEGQQEFAIDVLQVARQLKEDKPISIQAISKASVCLAHLGGGKIIDVNSVAEGLSPARTTEQPKCAPGRGECCSGR